MGWTFEAGMAPEQVPRVHGADLRSRNGAETGVEGPDHGPSKAGRTATGAKTGETVAMADLSARQRHDMGPNRAASGPLTHV